jgi:hypothetical protein
MCEISPLKGESSTVLASEHSRSLDCNRRPSQRDRLLEFLRSRNGAWVPLPEILDLHIAQYGARLHELRKAGFIIESRQEGSSSWFRLLGFTAPASAPKREPQFTQGELFAVQHRDLG